MTDGDVVSIDGKTICGSRDVTSKRAVHIISAWSHANQLSLGQVKVDEKSNEITAIPKLLNVLVLNGCLVTIDAMGCQRDIAAQIIEKGADRNYFQATNLSNKIKDFKQQTSNKISRKNVN